MVRHIHMHGKCLMKKVVDADHDEDWPLASVVGCGAEAAERLPWAAALVPVM